MLFSITNESYPVYDEESLLNTNDAFDYGQFRQLVESQQTSGSASLFAYRFRSSGVYVFKLSNNPNRKIVCCVCVHECMCVRTHACMCVCVCLCVCVSVGDIHGSYDCVECLLRRDNNLTVDLQSNRSGGTAPQMHKIAMLSLKENIVPL